MSPRLQRVLLGLLLLASLVMGGFLWRTLNRAHQRLLAGQDDAPTKAPQVAAPEQATLMVANDEDNSLLGQIHSLPLPADQGARARAILSKLLDLYAAPDARHPVPGGANAVAQVFLLPEPAAPPASKESSAAAAKAASVSAGPELAVVNLKGSFVAGHPSGLETETLTVLSICGTLHANFPRIAEVRFLVDGQTRPSLAGHADLTRTYLVSDAAPADLPVQVVHP